MPNQEEKKRDGGDDELEGSDASVYRAMVARANYLSQDRLDIRFAV